MAGELMAPTVGLTVMDATTRSTPGTPITADVRQEQVIANLRQQADDIRERERQRSRTMSNLGGGGFKAQEGPEAELRELRKSFKTMPTKEVPRDLAGKQPMQMSNPVEGAAQKINKWFYTAAVKEQQEQRAIQHQAYIASIEAMRKQAEKERQAQQQLLGMTDPLNEGEASEAFAPLTMPEPANAKESIDWWNKNIANANDPMRPTVSTWQEYQAVMGMAKAEQSRANVRLHPEAYIPSDYVSQMMDSGVSFNTIAQNAAFNWDTGRIDVKDHAGVALGSFSPEGGTMHGLVNRGGDYLIGLTTQMANVDRLTQSGLWDQATIDSVKGSLNMLDTLQQRMQAGKTETGTSFALPTNLQSDYDVWRKMRGAEVAGAETYQQNAARLISSPVLSDPDSGRHSATNQGKEIVSTVQVDGVGLTAAIDAAQNLKTLVNLPGGNSTAVNGLIGQGERMPTGISHSIGVGIGTGIGGGAMLGGLAVPVSPSPTATDTDNLRHASALVNQGGIPTVTPATPAIAAAVTTPSPDTLLNLYADRPSTLYNPDGLRFQQKIWGDSRIDAWSKYSPEDTAAGVDAMLAFYNQRNDAGNRINYMAPELRSNLLTEIAKSYSRGGASFNPVRQFADVYEKTENIQGLPFMDTYFGRAGSSHMSPDQRVNALASVVKTATDAGYRLSESQQEQYQKMVQSYDDQGFFSSSRTIDRQVPTAGQMLQYVRENAAIEGPSVDLGLARRQSAVGAPGSLIELYATQPKVFNPKGLTDQQKMLGDSRVDTSLKYTPVETREGIDTLVAIARAQGGMPAGVRESVLGDIARSYDRIPGVQGEDQFAAIHAELAGRIAVPAPVGRPAVTPVPSVPATQTPSVLLPKQSVGAGIGAGAGIPGLMYLTAMINTAKPSHPNYVVPTGIDQTAVASINEMLAGRQPLPAPPGAVVTPDVPEFTLFTSQAKTATIGGKGSLNTITETPLQIRAGEENWAQVSATLNQYVQHNDPIPAQVQTDLKKIVEENVQWETASDKRRAIQYIDDYTKMAEQTDRIDTLLTTMQTENRELTDGEIRDAYRIVSEIGKYDTEVARQYKGIVHDAEVKKYVDAGIGTLQEYGDSMDQAEIDRRIGGLNTAINQFGDDGLKTYYQAIPAGIMKAAPFIKDINRMFGVDPSHDWGALAKEGVLTDEGLQEAIAARDKAIDTQLAGMPDAFRTELKQNSRNAFEYYDIMSEANRLAADARASRITDAEFQTRSQALSDRMAKFDQTSGMTLFSAKSAYTNITTGKTEETGPTYGEQVMQDIAARKGEQFNEQMFRQGVADLPVVGGAVAAGMFGLETMGQMGEVAMQQFSDLISFNIGGVRIEPVRYLADKTGISGIFGAMQAPAVFSREAYIGLMHPNHQGITVEMPEFKKFALGLDESIGNEKRQWVTGEAAHAWSAGVREGIIGDQNDPLHTVRSGAAGVAGVGTGLATTPSMFATVGMVQAMESPATMAKISAGGVGRFLGSTGRYVATDPAGAISELGAAAVAGSYGPRTYGAIRARVPSIQTRPFALSQRVVESRPFRLAERAYQTSQVSRDQMGATWTALKMGERIRDLNVAPRNSADTILGWMPDSLKAGIRSGLQKTDGQHLITGEAPMKFALGDAGMPATELHRAMGDKFTRDGVQEVTILAEKPERAFLNLQREITAASREAGIPVDETVTILNRDRTPTGKRQETGDWKKTTRDTDTGRGDAIEISTPGVKFYQRTEASGDVSYLIGVVDEKLNPTMISVTKGRMEGKVIDPGYGVIRTFPVRSPSPARITVWQRLTGQNKPELTVTGSPVKDLALSDTESILNRGPEPGQIPTTTTIDGLNFHNPTDYYGRIVPEQIWLAGRMDRTNAVQARGVLGVRGALQDRYVDAVNAYRKYEFNKNRAKRDADILASFSDITETLPQTYQVAVPKPVQAAMHRVVAREPNTAFPAIADNMLINDVNQYVSSSHLRRPSLTTVPRKDRAFEQRNRQILTKQIDTDLYDLLAGARSIARVKEYELGGIGKSAATHPDAIDIRTINADLNKLGKMREDLQGLINDYRAGGERRARADAAVAEYRRDAATPKDLANPDIRRTDFDRDLYAQNAYIAEHGNKATLPTLELMLGDVDSAIRRQTAIHDVRTKMQAETFAEAERARRPGIGTRLRTLGRKTDVQKIDAIDTVLVDVQRPTSISRQRDALYQQETDLTTTINTLRPESKRTVWQGGVIIDDTVPISSDMARVLRTVPSKYVKKHTTTVPDVAETMTQRNLQTYLKGTEDYLADIHTQRTAVEQSPRNLIGRMTREYERRTGEEQLPFRDTERAALKNIPLPVNRDVSMVSQGHFANIYEWLDSTKHRQFKQDVGGSITDDTRPIGPVGSGKESATDSKPSTASVVRARDIVSKPSHDSSLGPTSGGSGGDVQSVLLDMSRQQESPQSTMTREYIWEDMIARPTRHTSAITPRFALSVGTGGTFGTFRDAVEPIEAPTPTVQKPGISLMMTTDLAKEQEVPYDVRTKTQLATIGVQGAAVEQKAATATTTTYAPAPAPTPTTPGRWGTSPIIPVVRRPITPRPPLRLPRLDLSGGGGKSDKKKIETGKRKIVHPIATPDQMIGKGVFSIRFNHLTVDKEMTKAWGMGATGKHTVNTTRRVKRTQVAANIGDALTTVTSMKRSKKIRGLVF